MLTVKEWLPDAYLAWIRRWFNDSDLDTAIGLCGLKPESITMVEVYESEPMYVNPHELVEERRTGYRTLSLNYKGHEWHRTERFTGSAWRVRDTYQHLRFPALTEFLLAGKLPWFKSFSWQVYGYPGENDKPYEKYLNCSPDRNEHMTLYVPIDCMLSGDVQGILDRTLSYAKSYNNDIASTGMVKATESPAALGLFRYMQEVRV